MATLTTFIATARQLASDLGLELVQVSELPNGTELLSTPTTVYVTPDVNPLPHLLALLDDEENDSPHHSQRPERV